MSHAPDEQAAAWLVHKAFPRSTVQRTWRLTGGISATMIAVEIQKPDGQLQKLIVRSHVYAALVEKEYCLLQILQAEGLKTPTPYLCHQADLSASLVIEYVAGEMSFTPTDLSSHMRQLADQLAQIHRLDLSGHNLAFLPHNNGQCAELKRERPSKNPTFPQEAEIRAVLATSGSPDGQNKLALLHGDYWPGNSLWRDGQLTAVIDWEDALLGDPLIDLAQSRSEIVWIFGPEALESFTQQYQQQMALDYGTLPYWDLCAALRQIRLVGDDLGGFADYFAGYGRSDITPQTIRQDLVHFIDHALARLNH